MIAAQTFSSAEHRADGPGLIQAGGACAGEHAELSRPAAEELFLVDLEGLAVWARMVRPPMWAARNNAVLARQQSLCRWMTLETLMDLRCGAAKNDGRPVFAVVDMPPPSPEIGNFYALLERALTKRC